MEPLHVPFFHLEQMGEKHYAVFLPGYRADEVQSQHIEFDSEESILQIYCEYDVNDRAKTEVYPVAISDLNREEFEDMEKLLVFSPDEYKPEQLTKDPEKQDRLREFFTKLEDMTGKQPMESPSDNPEP
ncbi:MAG: hypothetical protein ABEJ65_00875 [bacterium]